MASLGHNELIKVHPKKLEVVQYINILHGISQYTAAKVCIIRQKMYSQYVLYSYITLYSTLPLWNCTQQIQWCNKIADIYVSWYFWYQDACIAIRIVSQLSALYYPLKKSPQDLHFVFVLWWSVLYPYHNNGLVQERHNSIANTLQLCLFCTNP